LSAFHDDVTASFAKKIFGYQHKAGSNNNLLVVAVGQLNVAIASRYFDNCALLNYHMHPFANSKRQSQKFNVDCVECTVSERIGHSVIKFNPLYNSDFVGSTDHRLKSLHCDKCGKQVIIGGEMFALEWKTSSERRPFVQNTR
jgi:hypothetical protein